MKPPPPAPPVRLPPSYRDQPDDTIEVCWVGWLPLAALCGLVLGFIVGIGFTVFSGLA